MNTAFPTFIWPNEPPAGCPLEPSRLFTRIRFTGRHAEYTGADSWMPTWAADDSCYSIYMDGTAPAADGRKVDHKESGVARIVGADPLALQVEAVLPAHPDKPGDKPGDTGFFEGGKLGMAGPLSNVDNSSYHHGMYVCASFIHDGVWYVGPELRNMVFGKGAEGNRHNNFGQGPFLFFRISRDGGKTWTTPPHPLMPFRRDAHGTQKLMPLFSEPKHILGAVRFPVLHAVDMGKGTATDADGWAHFTSHGSLVPQWERLGSMAWNMGDQIYLCRTKPSPETINDAANWEFYAGPDAEGKPKWLKVLDAARPVIDWQGHTGCAHATWVPGLKRFMMCVGDGFCGGIGPSSTYVVEADRLTGPWRLVTYMKHFGPQAYITNIPSRFLSVDGRRFYLCYAANYLDWQSAGRANPPGSRYAMCLQEVELE